MPASLSRIAADTKFVSGADYVLYPNGTLDIHVACSNNPFRLETEEIVAD
ncbi:MAG: hypothetical protein M3Y53_10040 [Thermoproteota archaeon]|nr:hypothetical protein [Thermoproteota archaeon]